jgi:hypothetical protein
MRVPQMVSDFFEWRWAPCVGLTAGSLGFVALALLLIPTSIAGEPRVATTLSTFDSPPPQRALYGSSLARSLTEPAEPHPRVARSVPPPAPRSNEMRPPPQRGFSPIIDRPEPPAPPPAPPAEVVAPVAPAAPPEPVPGSTITIQPVPGGESREVTVQ